MKSPSPEQLATLLDDLRTCPVSHAHDLRRMLEAEERCGSATPDGFSSGRRGSGGAPMTPVEAAVVARQHAPADEHTTLTRSAHRELVLAARCVQLAAWALDGRDDLLAQSDDLVGLVRIVREAPRSSLEPRNVASRGVIAVGQAAGHLSLSRAAVVRCQALTGRRPDPTVCATPTCDHSAAREAGGRGDRCRRCVDWRQAHGDWPSVRVIAALDRGDRVAAARLARDR